MFDKYKERWAKLEEDHESVRKIKTHFEVNGKLYLVGAGCLTAGYLLRRPVKVINESPAPVFNNHVKPVIAPIMQNVVDNTVNHAGRLHKIVKRIGPDGAEELFETVGEAARELAPEYGIKASSAMDRISKVANGHLSDYKGDQFVFVGTGTR